MKKQRITIAVMASLLLTPIAVKADYYQYVDDLRKPGQSVEEAKKEQLESYQKTMQKKYAGVQATNNGPHSLTKEERARIKAQHRKLERRVIGQRLDLTDEQKSKLEALHEESAVFMKQKKKEVNEFREKQKKKFLDFLTDEQKEKMKDLQKPNVSGSSNQTNEQ